MHPILSGFFMTNYNGDIVSDDTKAITFENRGLTYGDAVFETMKVVNGRILFWESHYLRLMASMRIMRMEIPMEFTMEKLEGQTIKTIRANTLDHQPARAKMVVFRKRGGYYLPDQNNIAFYIQATAIDSPFYTLHEEDCEVDLYKDHYVSPSLLSTIKTNNKAVNVLGSIYAKENGLDDCLVLNTNKHVVEGLKGNLFLAKGSVIKTPPLTDGALGGIIRKQLVDIVGKIDDLTLEEASVSPFELQKADELFLTNVIQGIVSISRYRKKVYTNDVAKKLLGRLNAVARLA